MLANLSIAERLTMSTQERINACHPNVAPYFQRLKDALSEAIVIPNNYLPQDLRQFGRFENGRIGPDDNLSTQDLDDLSDDEYSLSGLSGPVYGRTIAEIEARTPDKELTEDEMITIENFDNFED